MDKCNEKSFYAAVIVVVMLVAVIVCGVVWKMKKNTYPLSAEEVDVRFRIAEIQKELRRSLPK